VYATKSFDVQSVIINGRVVMQNRRLLTLNEPQIKREAAVFREKIIKSLGIPSPKD
jgi:5-methylthioadenosine/S-adenosylhomocysteine deaminase